ncbi:MAG TPA: hypothetical protein VFL90_01375 [Methylomirabilota bacterium]|nr:hypothetical protein [Methylomirabilota bacterium]
MSWTGKLGTLVVAVALLLGVTSLAPAADTTVKLEPQNNSGESGTATLTPAGDSTKVVISITGGSGTNPTHIHKGTCDKLDPKPAFPLSPVVNGKSETTVKASMKELESGNYAINGHKSGQDLKTYVFCGNIPKGSM